MILEPHNLTIDIFYELEQIRNGKVIWKTGKQQSKSLLQNFMNIVFVGIFSANSQDVSTATVKDVLGTIYTLGTNVGDQGNDTNSNPLLVIGVGNTGVTLDDFNLVSQTYSQNADLPTTVVRSGNTLTRIYTTTFPVTQSITFAEAGMRVQSKINGTVRNVMIIRDVLSDQPLFANGDFAKLTYSVTIAA